MPIVEEQPAPNEYFKKCRFLILDNPNQNAAPSPPHKTVSDFQIAKQALDCIPFCTKHVKAKQKYMATDMRKAHSEPRVLRVGRSENLRFWEHQGPVDYSDAFKQSGDSVNGDTDSTASDCDSPNFIIYESRSSRRKAGSRSPTVRRGGGEGGSPSRSSDETQRRPQEDPSRTRRIQRSSNIPFRRPPRRANDLDSRTTVVVDDHLKQHYAMRTWDMYHRITQAHKGTAASPAAAASIDHLLPQGYASPPSLATVDLPPQEVEEPTHLEQDMIFPLDE